MRNVSDFANEPQRYMRMLDVRYGARLNLLHERLYGRMNSVLSFVLALAGMSAFGGFLADKPGLAGVAGLVVAVLSAITVTIDPGGRAIRFDAQRERYADLDGSADVMPIADLERRLTETQGRVQRGELEALRNLAYNDNLLANGREDARAPEGRAERFARLLLD